MCAAAAAAGCCYAAACRDLPPQGPQDSADVCVQGYKRYYIDGCIYSIYHAVIGYDSYSIGVLYIHCDTACNYAAGTICECEC